MNKKLDKLHIFISTLLATMLTAGMIQQTFDLTSMEWSRKLSMNIGLFVAFSFVACVAMEVHRSIIAHITELHTKKDESKG